MKRILLIIPRTSYRAGVFMKASGRLVVELVVASNLRPSLGQLVPDTTFRLNFRHPDFIAEKVREFAVRKPFDAVVGVDDISVYAAAIVAEALGLPHNPPETVAASHNKLLMRQKMIAAGLKIPNFQRLSVKDNPKRMIKKLSFPCVLKPVFLSASRGVTRVDTAEQFVAAFEEICGLLADPEVKALAYNDEAEYLLAEDYIPGIEIALEGLLIDGEIKTLALFDKPDPLEGPYFVETIYQTPSRLPAYTQREAIHAAHRAALALGLRNGPIHTEIRLNAAGAWVVEIAARSIGGLCSQVLKFQGNISLEELILRHALGEDVNNTQREKSAAAVMIPIPAEGVLKEVKNIEVARAVEGIEDVLITIPPGQRVIPMPRGGRYLGFIFARADWPEDAEAAMREAHRRLEAVIE